MESLTILIPTRGCASILLPCLESLVDQLAEGDRIHLLWNSENPVPDLTGTPQTIVHRLAEFDGFSRLLNEGLRRIDGDWLLLLNDDTRVDANLLENWRRLRSQHPDIPAFACRLLNASHPARIDSVGDCLSAYWIPDKMGWQRPAANQFTDKELVFGPSGAAFFCCRKWLGDGYDTHLRSYLEDIDRTIAARLRGDLTLYCPELVVYHLAGATFQKKGRAWLARRLARNRRYLLRKYRPLWNYRLRDRFGVWMGFWRYGFRIGIQWRVPVAYWQGWRQAAKIPDDRQLAQLPTDQMLEEWHSWLRRPRRQLQP